jgi:tetratricopeptide (TPR) repeat protein
VLPGSYQDAVQQRQLKAEVEMSEKEKYTIAEAHELFAKRLNGEVWRLLEKTDRTTADDESMVAAAFASHYHWFHVGNEVNRQRGEWMIARVYTVLGNVQMAMAHASRCLDLTERYKDMMADFDIAFAYEGIARAHALAGKEDEAKKFLQLAEEAGDEIEENEDKEIFLGDLRGGNWYGIR